MIRVEHLFVRSGQFELRDVHFEIASGQYGVLMGKTGYGKTTLLEAICGLRTVLAGRILLDDQDVTNWQPGERGIGYVPQDKALFSTMTVAGNLEFGLRLRHWPAPKRRARINELADMLGITHLLARSVHGLSGGEQQRVALGRALAPQPVLLILDEPLSALDDDTRHEMHTLLKDIRRQTHITALHVTHFRHDAEQLADKVLQLAQGRITEMPLTRT